MRDAEKRAYWWRVQNEQCICLLRNGDEVRTVLLNCQAGTEDNVEIAKWVVAACHSNLREGFKGDPEKLSKIDALIGEMWELFKGD